MMHINYFQPNVLQGLNSRLTRQVTNLDLLRSHSHHNGLRCSIIRDLVHERSSGTPHHHQHRLDSHGLQLLDDTLLPSSFTSFRQTPSSSFASYDHHKWLYRPYLRSCLWISALYSPQMLKAVTVISKLEILFYIQEIFLSSLYAFLFVKFIGRESISNSNSEIISSSSKSTSNQAKRTFLGLVAAQLLVLVCDITMIVLLYKGLYLARKLVMPFNYAIKVLLEYFVLNRLVRFSSTYTRGAVIQVEESESSGVQAVNGILGSRVCLE